MKEEIFAIPLWDAFRKDTECPLCAIQMDVEKRYIESVLEGETFMDWDFTISEGIILFVKNTLGDFLNIRKNCEWL